MGIFNFFSASAEKELARGLVSQLVKDLPPILMKDKRQILSVNKITRLLEKTYAAAARHQQAHRLGMVKRAILANHFKWELKNKDYPDDFVNIATEGLVMELTKVGTEKQRTT